MRYGHLIFLINSLMSFEECVKVVDLSNARIISMEQEQPLAFEEGCQFLEVPFEQFAEACPEFAAKLPSDHQMLTVAFVVPRATEPKITEIVEDEAGPSSSSAQ